MKLSCNVIFDLIPLVKDGVASDDSTLIVNEHIKNCKSCKVEFETFEANNIEQTSIQDEKIIFAIKRSIFMTQFIILFIGGIIGVALTNSMGMFYNFLIMPIIGVVSFITLKRKWYFTPIVIFILTYIWQTIKMIVLYGFDWTYLYSEFFYSIIYSILVSVGALIVMLLKFAFKKER